MIRKYSWHFLFLLFIILALINLFQKVKVLHPSDDIVWQEVTTGQSADTKLVCVSAPEHTGILPGDRLWEINEIEVKNHIDLMRIWERENFFKYLISRDREGGRWRTFNISVVNQPTDPAYFILVFAGIMSLLLSLRILSTTITTQVSLSAPPSFYLLSLSFAGFLIFSPIGTYQGADFLFLILHTVSFLFFPAILLQYSLTYPIKNPVFRRVNAPLLSRIIFLPPIVLLGVEIYSLLSAIKTPDITRLSQLISFFRQYELILFTIYIIASLLIFLWVAFLLVALKKRRKFMLPMGGLLIGLAYLIMIGLFSLLSHEPPDFVLSHFFTALIPFGLTYCLSRHRYSDVEIVIKKTLSLSFIFLFIFGVYFFLGSGFEQSRLMGIFWSLVAIMTAGLLFKPIEETVQHQFERFFYKHTFSFRNRLKELMLSIQTERNLIALSINFLSTINKGLGLKNSILIIQHRKNIFYTLPEQDKLILSKRFCDYMVLKDHYSFASPSAFANRFEREYDQLGSHGFMQFLPLKRDNKLIGLVAMSHKAKKEQSFLSLEDWDLLSNIASSLTLSVENASLYSALQSQLSEINLLKEFNENIIHNINLGIVVLNRLNIIRTWNSVMEQKFAKKAEDVIHHKAFSVFDKSLWKQILRHKHKVSTISGLQVTIQDRLFFFDIHISPLINKQQSIIGSILVFEDITEKNWIQQKLVTSEKMASIGLLSAGIAHEINTPLTGISSYCQLILENPKDPDNEELIKRMQEQVNRANRIVRSLLDFSRQKGEQPTQVTITRIIDESLHLLEHRLKKKSIALRLNLRDNRSITGFPTRLQQMIINLVINAIDAIPGNDGAISIQTLAKGDLMQIQISDTGQGIPTEYFKKIFDPFFTTKSEGQGTGLGLSIVFAIVKEHFGEIQVQSSSEKGTTFLIEIPITSPLRRIKI